MTALWIGLGVLVVVLLVWGYNSMMSLRTRSQAALSDIDTQLKKRYDLIPQLVEVAKGYMKHEQDVFTRVAELRSSAMGIQDIQKRATIEHNISSALSNFFILAEQYPDLKAAPQFLSLQNSLSKAEDDISHARRYYNAVVRDYNTLIHVFPLSLLAMSFRFQREEFFSMEENEKAAPNVALQ